MRFVHHNENRRQNTKGIGGGENHEEEEEEEKENIIRGGLIQQLGLSGRLLNKSRYLSSHGDQIGNAGQTRRSPPTKIRTYRSKPSNPCPSSIYTRVWHALSVKCSMQKMPQRFSVLNSLSPILFASCLSLVCIEFETLRLWKKRGAPCFSIVWAMPRFLFQWLMDYSFVFCRLYLVYQSLFFSLFLAVSLEWLIDFLSTPNAKCKWKKIWTWKKIKLFLFGFDSGIYRY